MVLVLPADGYPAMLAGLGWRSQSQCRRIGLQMNPIELGERLGRWSSGRGPLHVLLAARLRRLIDEGELPPGEPLPPDRALARRSRSAGAPWSPPTTCCARTGGSSGGGAAAPGSPGPSPPAPRQTTSAPMFLHLLEPRRRRDPAGVRRPGHAAARTGRRVRPHRADAGPHLRGYRLLPGRPPGAAPRHRRPLHRARDPHRAGAASWSPPAASRRCPCLPARSWRQATGCWWRGPPTRARWRRSGSRRPCRVRCRSGSAASPPRRASSAPPWPT